jgi:hypothetical protein
MVAAAMTPDERATLESEITVPKDLIARTPRERVIDRKSLENRLERVVDELGDD